jgi:hypothetical protein
MSQANLRPNRAVHERLSAALAVRSIQSALADFSFDNPDLLLKPREETIPGKRDNPRLKISALSLALRCAPT